MIFPLISVNSLYNSHERHMPCFKKFFYTKYLRLQNPATSNLDSSRIRRRDFVYSMLHRFNYTLSLTSINAYPSRFCPRHCFESILPFLYRCKIFQRIWSTKTNNFFSILKLNYIFFITKICFLNIHYNILFIIIISIINPYRNPLISHIIPCSFTIVCTFHKTDPHTT